MATGVQIISGLSPASATTAVIGSAVSALDEYDALMIVATLQGATGGTLDIYLQVNPSDDGATWVDYAHFPQLTAAAAATTKVWSVAKAAQVTTLATVGRDLTPALPANTVLGGPWGRQMRAIAVAGVGTSAGAQQSITIMGQRGPLPD